jgi:pilus assembly protein Flp/PilA
MHDHLRTFDRFLCDENGATMVEYSILIGLISVVAVALIAGVGRWVKTAWTNVNAILASNPVAS